MNVIIEFTAPGDDFDVGKASEYKIKFVDDASLLQDPYWDDIPQSSMITQDDLLSGSLTPIIAGSKVQFTVSGSTFDEGKPFFMAMKAIDAAKVTSDLSNIVTFERDNTPPNNVTDLALEIVNESETPLISIKFTAPGDDIGVGTASLYELKFTENRTLLNDPYWNDLDLTQTISKYDVENGTLVPQLSGSNVTIVVMGTKFEPGIVYYLGMKSYDNLGLASNVSNIVEFEKDNDSGLSGGQLAGIVIGCMALGFVLVVVGYFVYQKVAQ